MQNRFGVKDFVIILLVCITGLLVFLSMNQADRQWKEFLGLTSKIDSIERQAARVQTTLDTAEITAIRDRLNTLSRDMAEVKQQIASGVKVSGTTSGSAAAGTPADSNAATERDESWAVKGIPIAWQPERVFDTLPQSQPGYAEGGELTEIFNAQPQTVMPLIYKDVYGAWVFERITEYLAEWDPKTLELRGVLAQAWQYAPDGTWLRVRLHPRARFSDGEPVLAEDVIWTFQWMRNQQVQAERTRSVTDFISEITQVDERTVEFKFKQILFTNLSGAMGSFPILPKHFYENFTPTQYNQATGLVVGSGPFKFASSSIENQWTPGTDVVLVRNEQYWGPKPPFERLRFKVNRDDLARLTAFNNGEGDWTTPSSTQFATVSKNEEWLAKGNQARMWYNIRGGYNFIGWNCGKRGDTNTVFADKRVRRAMTMMLDRDLIVREIFAGLARPATGPFNSVTPQSNPNIKPLPYDLAGARKLLKEAGWEDRDGDGQIENAEGKPFAFEFTFPTGNEATERLVKYTKDQAAKLGIQCTLKPMDWSVFMSTLDNRDYDAMTLGWSPASPESDPQQIWHSRYIQNQGDNFVQWANAEVDEIVEKGRQELDKAKRMTYWHRMHQIIHDEQPYTFIAERPWLRIVGPRVGNFNEYRNGYQYDELFVRGPASLTNN